MPEAQHLAEGLRELFTNPDFYWFASYPPAVEGLTAEQAGCAPGPRFNSVWGVILHLTICQQFALAVLHGDRVDPAAFFAEGTWPQVRDESAGAWEKAKADILAANHALAECVAGLPDTMLDEELPVVGMKGYTFIQGHLVHISNHLNEIVAIRHMQGLWLEKT